MNRNVLQRVDQVVTVNSSVIHPEKTTILLVDLTPAYFFRSSRSRIFVQNVFQKLARYLKTRDTQNFQNAFSH
ncbi:MAG: hypothetical protein A3I77_08250 [Gammaproteobacteria bacterium RIFCSPLOWO2_02_FULL_42_14]|nr:MAG: hypothetical protein A3B71_04085 [Gammaproteobacteria bacterium RIFCSPHIGHO2_02_FULL_42_43]OGT61322.1 MAG: hypothetical protein A3I77_08250 [Gammaproteobacteria bacterium RIFCSPLOWO2_02_FULL_42_14]OGT87251.1 MAG: hypothetical protein A3G86_01975 [Gammaproteobacteria bacterium RIFCSPLOWO2_12_FULL_42_18]